MNRNLERFTRDLRALHIQGATAVAHETLRALEEYVRSQTVPRSPHDWKALHTVADEISTIRPTEPLARNLARWYMGKLAGTWHKNIPLGTWQQKAASCAQDIRYELKEAEARLTANGLKLVKAGDKIFTHCHSSLAERILVGAKQAGKNFAVYHTETRPLYQGHITDERLRQAGINATMVVDSAAAYLVSKHSGDTVDISWVLLGADSIGRDGSVLNKVGSFGIALAAYDSKIPVYVATTLLKFDALHESTIEQRAASEVWSGAPKGTSIVNYAFDRMPAKFISGIVCEFGIVKPAGVARLVASHYPELTLKAKNN